MALGWIYEHGLGGHLDYSQALEWYRIAADAGDNRGRNALGWMSENGLGCDRDYGRAFIWYRTAAEAGDNGGRYNMGRVYQYGLGVEKNIATAAKWYRKGALGGDPGGWGNLARMYADERGVGLKLVRVDSEDTASQEEGRGENAVDGNPDTFWRTQWQGNNSGLPHEIVIELVTPSTIKGFTYLPRQDDWNLGDIKDYEFYASDDGKEFGQPVKIGTFQSGKEKRTATFDSVKCRFIKLKAISEIKGRSCTSAAEIGVILNSE
jgi:hypothetical protein